MFNFNEMVSGVFTQYEAEVRARANDIANAIYDIRAALWSQVDTGNGDVREESKWARVTVPVGPNGTATPIDVYTVPRGSRGVIRSILKNNTAGSLLLFLDSDTAWILNTGSVGSISADIPVRGGETVRVYSSSAQTATICMEVYTPQVPLVGKPTGVEPEVGSRWTSDGLAKQTPANTVVPQGPESMGS